MIFGSQLTDEQLAERRKGIGASDAAKILAGGEAWVELWKDKTSREIPKRIMSEWNAALRHTTEALQCDWYEHKHERTVVQRGVACSWHEWPVLKCTLDGFLCDPPAREVFEVKHVSEYTPKPIEWACEKYTPQVCHQMIVCKTDKAIMSVMVGMKEPEIINFTLDPFWAEVYVTKCREFWSYVEDDYPPPGSAEFLPPPVAHEAMKVIDFNSSNSFTNFAADWLANKDAAKLHADAATGLKKLIPDDCREGFGAGVKITRSKAGALTIKAEKK